MSLMFGFRTTDPSCPSETSIVNIFSLKTASVYKTFSFNDDIVGDVKCSNRFVAVVRFAAFDMTIENWD
jgi:hypothetical protein